MTKRAFLKTLAFMTGLFFVLEFFLPDKVGGRFDSYEVHAPAPVQTSSGTHLFYAGSYADRLPALGGLTRTAPSAPWLPLSENPLLQRSPLVPEDLTGMQHLAGLPAKGWIELFYIGTSAGQNTTLCHASGSTDGLQWYRKPPPRFLPPSPPLQRAGQTHLRPNGPLPGNMEGFAVDYSNDQWTFLLLLRITGKGLSVWQATGRELTALQLAETPLCPPESIPADVTAFDGARAGSGWTLFFVALNQLTTVTIDSHGTLTQSTPRQLVATGERVTAFRTAHDGFYISSARDRHPTPPREFSPRDTQLLLLPTTEHASPVMIHHPGPRPTPTYLSRGILTAGTFLQIIVATALLIPVINLSLFHGKKIARLTPGWSMSGIFFICLIGMFLITLAGKGTGTTQGQSELWTQTYSFLFKSIIQPMGTAVFSMIAFYMVSAAYRSFRVRSLESILLMASACIVMIGQMPLGELQASVLPDSTYYLGLPWLSQKLLTVINACAYRGVLIGLTIGGISIAIRIWLGLDNSVYSGLEGKPR